MLTNAKSIDPNSMPTKLVKMLAPHMSLPISAIITNESFQPSSFTTKINWLSLLSKSIEKIMHRRLWLLKEHNILYSLQFGFLAKHSVIMH